MKHLTYNFTKKLSATEIISLSFYIIYYNLRDLIQELYYHIMYGIGFLEILERPRGKCYVDIPNSRVRPRGLSYTGKWVDAKAKDLDYGSPTVNIHSFELH